MILFLGFLPLALKAQDLSNKRKKWVQLNEDSIYLDSLSIVPGSFFFLGDALPDSTGYSLDPFSSLLLLDSAVQRQDSIQVKYRVFPLNMTEEKRNKPMDIMLSERPEQIDPFVFRPGVLKNDEFGFDQLNKSGSVSRGIAFGNSQDLSVNSTLNLQLSGKITEDISVLASITDDNLPIQPQGNTQQLQDFDRVFIQLYDDKSKLTAGDFQLKSRRSYFLKYFKRAQGATFETQFPLSNDENNIFLEASAAISKGKFARNQIQGIEGNQGPYRLRGADNERFIIILAGTERVYIDGRLLKRGQEFDYIVDYNTAEITFTPNQFITKDRRIVVEFQYSDKNYARALIQAHGQAEIGKGKVFFTLYNEQDSKNQPLQQELDDRSRLVLENAGDDPLNAVINSVDSTSFSNDFVQYALRDSLGYDSVFVFSSDPEQAFYRVSFSPVGQGNGDYVEDDFTAVGRVYRWVAPDTIDNVIIRNGNHAPVNILIAPQKQQAFSLGTAWDWGKTKMEVEGTVTVFDRNTFSDIDREDDLGSAVKTRISHELTLSDDSIPWTMQAFADHEYVQQNFNRLERFRAVEFERNWNILGRQLNGDQHVGAAGVDFLKQGLGKVRLGGETFLSGSDYSGYKAVLFTDLRREDFKVFIDGSYLLTDGLLNTDFLRHRGELNKKFGKFLIGYRDEHEQNRFELPGDSLAGNSYRFYEWKAYSQYGDTTGTFIRAFYGGRTDWLSDSLSLQVAADAEQYGAKLGFSDIGRHNASITVSNRELKIRDAALLDQEPESTLLGRLEHRYSGNRNWLSTDMFYEVGSGLEQRREFIYLEVPAGQGVYVWNDYDEDGIKDLNEFEVAQFSYEANYIRSFTPTDEYERVYSNQFSFSMRFRPGAWSSLNNASFLGDVLSRITDQFSYKTSKRTTREDSERRFNPFDDAIEESALLSQTSSLRNTLFFNRTNPKYGIDYTFQQIQTKNLLTGGFESREQQFDQIRIRWNPLRIATVELSTEQGSRNNASDFIDNRNYRINYTTITPSVSWQPNNTLRLTAKGSYTEKSNDVEFGAEQAILRELSAELRYNVATKGSLLLNVGTVNIDYTGEEVDNSLGFEMLQGFRPGSNYTWSAGIQKTLSNNIQINLNYNGRRSEGAPTIHAGAVQVRAFF